MNATLCLLKKECSLFLRDKTAIVMVFIVPFVLIAIMGNIFGNLGDKNGGPSMKAKLAVGFEDPSSPASKILLERLQAEPSLDIIASKTDGSGGEFPLDEADLRLGIAGRLYNFALFVPEDLVQTERIGLKLKLIYNPRNEIETQMVSGLMQKAIFQALPWLLAESMDQQARTHMGDATYDSILDGVAALLSLTLPEASYEQIRRNMGFAGLARALEERLWKADETAQAPDEEESSSASFLGDILEIEKDQVAGKEVQNPELTRMIGGYGIMFLLFAVTGSAAALFEEKNEGIFVRLLSMPVKRQHILWSKYLFNTLLGMVQIVTLFFFGSLLFGIQIYHNLASLLAISAASALACTAFGMALASVARTPAQAQGFGTLLILSMSSLGGAWWPVEFMSEPLQMLARFTIVYWGVQGFLGALWEGLALWQLLPEIGMILLFAIVLNAFSLWRFNRGDLFR